MPNYPGNGKTAFLPEMFQGANPGEPTSAQLQAQSEHPFYMRPAPTKAANAVLRANPNVNLREQKFAARQAARAAANANNANANANASANNANSNSEQTPESDNSTTRQLFGGAKRKHRRTKKSKKSKKSKKTRRNR